jgi:enamine deaminase RidA (YjgF/YER057c/UK114 family)
VTNRPIDPQSIAPPAAAYRHAMLSERPERILHTAGVVPIRPDGTVPEAVGEQAQTVWANIAAMLAEADMEPSDIVAATTYVIPGQDLSAVMAARDAFFAGHLVASVLVVVAALVRPEWKIEVSVVAAR